MRRWAAIGSLLAAVLVAFPPIPAAAHDPLGWIVAGDPGLELIPSEQALTDHPNECEGSASTPRYNGTDPDWVRVGGNPDPSTPFVEAKGQVLQDGPLASESYNPRVTHDDNFWSHWSQDFNVWLTLDPEDRHLLGTGNMGGDEEGGNSHREHARLEVEWERAAIPLFAWPALGDRMVVWGTHIWDCGHPPYRTEIHPPVGWVTYRQTADSDDSPCIPTTNDCSKRFQTPWNWYSPTDLQGGTARFTDPSMPRVPIQATVADVFLSDFGGWTALSLNGCRDGQPTGPGSDPSGAQDAPCSGDSTWRGWRQSLLQQDYTFFVPAPPQPSPQARMVWETEDRCSQVPSSPGNPPGADIEDVGEAPLFSTARTLGKPACTIPFSVEETTENGRSGIRVTVNANDPSVTYPKNNYIAFARRIRVGWTFAPPASERARTYRVTFEKLRVYDDHETCGEDGEWVMSLAVNERWLHPVRGHGDFGRPFWSFGAVDDGKCLDPRAYAVYKIGETVDVTVQHDAFIHVFEYSYDIDAAVNQKNPVINAFINPTPGMNKRFVSGVADDDVGGAHTIVYTIRDITEPYPDLELLAFPTTFIVRNIGDADAGPFVVRIDGAGDFTFPGLAAGSSETRTIDCSTTSRAAVADPDDTVIEAFEGNNSTTVPPCPLPDLVISDASATSFTVKNTGDAAAGAFVVRVSEVGDFSFDGLAAGATAFRSLPCADHDRSAAADANAQVSESDETNNTRTVPAGDCKHPQPDLVISEADAIHFVVKNIGTADAGPFVVTVTGEGDFSFSGLAAGASESRDLHCSEFDRSATADSKDQVKESDESNNSRTVPGTFC
ncbi:MAG: CARDB domain-containing protein [Actinomycetota bacterium]